MGLPEPRILYVALSCAANRARAEAVVASWGRDVEGASRLVFAGDQTLASGVGDDRVWPCVEAGGPNDHDRARPIKLREAFRRALAAPGWDFVVTVDDSTLVVPRRLAAILSEVDRRSPIVLGGDVLRASSGSWDNPRLNDGGAREVSFFATASGFVLTRVALEQAWPELEPMLAVHGAEDVFTFEALRRARVTMKRMPEAFRGSFDAAVLAHETTVTMHGVPREQMRGVYERVRTNEEMPFAVAQFSVGSGGLGLGGDLGLGDQKVTIDGEEIRNAIGAHAPCRVVLRGTPGFTFELRGALDDSVPEGRDIFATFAVRDTDRRPVANLGTARRGQPTEPVKVTFPAGGSLVLQVNDLRAACHTVWLWSAPAWEAERAEREAAVERGVAEAEEAAQAAERAEQERLEALSDDERRAKEDAENAAIAEQARLERLDSEEAARVADLAEQERLERLASEEAARVAALAEQARLEKLASEEAARVAALAEQARLEQLASEEAARVAALAEQARLEKLASEEAARVAALAEQEARFAAEYAALEAQEAEAAREQADAKARLAQQQADDEARAAAEFARARELARLARERAEQEYWEQEARARAAAEARDAEEQARIKAFTQRTILGVGAPSALARPASRRIEVAEPAIELAADDVALLEDSIPPPPHVLVIQIDEVVEELPDDAEVPDVPSWSGPVSRSRRSWSGIGPPALTRDQVAISLFFEHPDSDEDSES